MNLHLVIEGEEEIGSASLGPFLSENRGALKCDVAVVSDTGMIARGVPTLTAITRSTPMARATSTGRLSVRPPSPRICVCTSVGANTPLPGVGIYGASKRGLLAAAESLRLELFNTLQSKAQGVSGLTPATIGILLGLLRKRSWSIAASGTFSLSTTKPLCRSCIGYAAAEGDRHSLMKAARRQGRGYGKPMRPVIRPPFKARTTEELMALLSAVATAILAAMIIAMLYFGTIVTAFGVAVMQPSLPPLVRAWEIGRAHV